MNPFETAVAGPSGERPFKCEECGNVDISKSNETETITVILYLFIQVVA